jgi:transposase
VRVVDAFVGELDLAVLGFARAAPSSPERPTYHPAALLKIYLYGYLKSVSKNHPLVLTAPRLPRSRFAANSCT